MQNVVDAFERGDWENTCQLATNELISHAGLDLLHISGLSHMQMHQFETGMILLKAVIAFQPSAVHMYSNAAQAAEQIGRIDDLAFFVEQGLTAFPNDEKLRRQQGNLCLMRMDYPRALHIYLGLLADDPNNVAVLINLGNTYRVLNEFGLAESYFTTAAKLEPNNTLLLIGRASLYGDLGRIPEAISMLEGMSDNDAQYILALYLLAIGDYERGWRLHRNRWDCLLFKGITRPLRNCDRLEQIKGQKIVVLREGGFGDVFQFIRYLPALAKLASEIIMHATPSDLSLLQANVPSNVTIQSVLSTSSTQFTCYIPDVNTYTIALLDLPYLFGTTLNTIPATLPYIKVPAKNLKQCRLPFTHKKRVGLTWAGGGTTGLNERPYDAQRSIDLHEFARFADLSTEIEFINLQFGAHADDLGFETTRVLELSGEWADTAVIIAQLDLIISVDTAIVHLAAAMGKPTWLLSRFNPCWRWLCNRGDNPWYPNVLKVFGQATYGNWGPTLDHVHTELISTFYL